MYSKWFIWTALSSFSRSDYCSTEVVSSSEKEPQKANSGATTPIAVCTSLAKTGQLTCPSVESAAPALVSNGTSFPSEGLSPNRYRDASHRLLRGSNMVRRYMWRKPPRRRLCWYLSFMQRSRGGDDCTESEATRPGMYILVWMLVFHITWRE